MYDFSFNADAFLLKLDQIPENINIGLNRAAIYLLSEAQNTIKSGGQGWPGFKKPPKDGHQLLWEKGRLIGSLAPNGAGNIFDQEDNTITFGSNLSYAASLNYGYQPRNLPARPFLFIDDQRAKNAMQIIAQYLFNANASQ